MAYTNPGPSTTTGSTNVLDAQGPNQIGASSTATVAFYGKTPIAQRSAAAQASSIINALTSTASTEGVNIAVKNALIEIQSTLTALGLWKGSN